MTKIKYFGVCEGAEFMNVNTFPKSRGHCATGVEQDTTLGGHTAHRANACQAPPQTVTQTPALWDPTLRQCAWPGNRKNHTTPTTGFHTNLEWISTSLFLFCLQNDPDKSHLLPSMSSLGLSGSPCSSSSKPPTKQLPQNLSKSLFK